MVALRENRRIEGISFDSSRHATNSLMNGEIMPVLHKGKHGQLIGELSRRYSNLVEAMKKRDLSGPHEGANGKKWAQPHLMCATAGNAIEVSLAVEDFKAILAEIKKLK